jgi:hypothetical protein
MLKDHHGGHNPAKAFTSTGAVGKEFNGRIHHHLDDHELMREMALT